MIAVKFLLHISNPSQDIFFENGPLTYFQALFPHSEICSNVWTWMSLKLLKTFSLVGLTIKMSQIWDYTNKNLHNAKNPASDYFRMEHRWISQYCNIKHVKYFSTEMKKILSPFSLHPGFSSSHVWWRFVLGEKWGKIMLHELLNREQFFEFWETFGDSEVKIANTGNNRKACVTALLLLCTATSLVLRHKYAKLNSVIVI